MNLNTKQNLTQKIKKAVESSHVPLILLNAKNIKVKKCSILANRDHEFVHQFNQMLGILNTSLVNLDYANVDLLRKKNEIAIGYRC